MSEIKPEVLESFKMMWNLYPAPVMLVNKNRDILALNKIAQGLGISPEAKCHHLATNDTICPGCKGNAALHKKEAMRKVSYSNVQGKCLDGYWVPVDGEDDLMIHFGNDISDFVRPELMK